MQQSTMKYDFPVETLFSYFEVEKQIVIQLLEELSDEKSDCA